MPVFTLDQLELHYGEQVIFDHLNLVVQPGDRLALVGRNGVGKSTLLKVIAGQVQLDGGHLRCDDSTKISMLDQNLPEPRSISVFEFVAEGLGSVGGDLARYQQLSQQVDMASMDELAKVQQRIESVDGWSANTRIEQVLTRLNLDGDAAMNALSGGWRRRAALAQALVVQPDVLLMDEPTNHLDIKAIEWLEQQFRDFTGAIVFVTHDRAFLQSLANRIGELDRGHLRVWDGTYDGFLRFREQQLAEQEKHNAAFDKRLAEEEVWIRQGIKARRTRNEGRVRALKEMREERAQRRDKLGTVDMAISKGAASGKQVAEFQNVSFGWQDEAILKNFSAMILRGDKVGLIGPNGIGKSTFLKLMLGDLQPQTGSVRLGTQLQVAYFDQLREQLDLEKSAMDNIAEGRERVDINGQSRHIISYLSDFMFTGERARTPVKTLSGGERNRILLAKLFSKPANILVLDEPTNDLDTETLELLEELLVNFDGTVFLVSHDRAFLNNVVTSTIAFEGGGRVREYVGGYQDWLRQGGIWPEDTSGQKSISTTSDAGRQKAEPAPQKKRSYKLQRELDALPALIEQLEQEIESLGKEIADPAFYEQDPEQVRVQTQLLADKQASLQTAYDRWEALEACR